MAAFDHIAIIFNPKSTGEAPKMAKDLADSINGHQEVIKKKSVLYPTTHAGHAIELAHDIAFKYDRPLIVSVSGDGGYNEVLCGVMNARRERRGAKPVIAVMPAGNANDHQRVMRGGTPLIRLIKAAEPKPMDVISITAKSTEGTVQRYAHSYIGFGITPEVGHQLNRHGKGLFNEFRVIIQTVGQFTPFTIIREGRTLRLDSLVFANINEMAKVVKLDTKNTVRDGMFEVIVIKHRGWLHMVRALVMAAIRGFRHAPSFATYTFTTLEAQPVQRDGEIEQLPERCEVTIRSHGDAIESLY